MFFGLRIFRGKRVALKYVIMSCLKWNENKCLRYVKLLKKDKGGVFAYIYNAASLAWNFVQHQCFNESILV